MTENDRPFVSTFFEGMPAATRRVVRSICRGNTNKAIALDLGVSEDTVKRHMTSAIRILTDRGLLRYEDSPRNRMAYLMGLADGMAGRELKRET
jgi:FixJ family two-component response regulator